MISCLQKDNIHKNKSNKEMAQNLPTHLVHIYLKLLALHSNKKKEKINTITDRLVGCYFNVTNKVSPEKLHDFG